MRKLRLFLAFLITVISAYSFSEERKGDVECAAISCDCNTLPSNSWKSLCVKKENSLKADCKNPATKALGYCSIHGPSANRIPITLNISTTSEEQSNSFKVLHYKFAAIYWSIYKDMGFIEVAVEEQQFAMAEERLHILQTNSNNLFDIQKQLTALLKESHNSPQLKKSWNTYSKDIETVGHRLNDYADTLLANFAKSKHQEKYQQLALNLTETAGDLFEQVGYSYYKGKHYQKAAKAWKKSADIASFMISQATKHNDLQQAEFYRYQAATRLHRASYNWTLAVNQKNAHSTLIEAQRYMDNKEELEPLIKEGAIVSN